MTLSHGRYGAYLSQEDVAELVAPHSETLELVSSWLEHHHVPSSSISTTLGRNWLMVVNVPVSQANVILSASYQLYQHVERNETVFRTISCSLPEALHGHIQTVLPAMYFDASTVMQVAKRRMRPSEAAEARTKVGPSGELVIGLPATLRWLYKRMGYVPAAADIGDGKDAYYTAELVNAGGYDPDDPGIEANLDLRYAEGLEYPTPITYDSTAGTLSSDSDPHIRWLAFLIGQKTIPQTISKSYGDYEYSTPLD